MKVTVGCLILLFVSCSKYLDIQSNHGLVVPTKLEDLQKLMDDAGIMNLSYSSFGEASADDYYLKQPIFDNLIDYAQNTYIWKNYYRNYPNDWSSGYNAVYNCNLVLDRLKSISVNSVDESFYNEVKGSALFYRASQYLYLLWTYAPAFIEGKSKDDLGIVLRNSSDFNEISSRSTVAACYLKIIDDLNACIDLLPEKSALTLRPNRYAAMGMLARTYLSMHNYDKALLYADKVLKKYPELMDYNNLSEVNVDASFPFTIFNKETVWYGELMSSSNLTSSRALIDTLLYRSFDSNDLRKKAFFKVAPDGTATFKGSYSGSAKMFTGIAINEMYLIRAECNLRLGNREKALDALNYLMKKRYKTGIFKPYSSIDEREVLTIILKERRRELIFRGLRWMDLKRLNAEGAEIVIQRNVNGEIQTLLPNSNAYALPLPDDIIRLAGIEQNPQ